MLLKKRPAARAPACQGDVAPSPEPEEDDVDSEENEQHKFIAGALDVSGSAETSYGTKTADDMGMQIHEGSAVSGQVFEDVDEATLEDET